MSKIKSLYNRYLQKGMKNAYVHFIAFGVLILILNIFKEVGIIRSGFMDEMANFLIIGIAVLGFLILLGFGGLASLGTAVFIALGGFFTRSFIMAGIPPLTTLLLVILIGVVLGMSIGFLSLRISGMYLAIITLVIGEIIIELMKTSAFIPFSAGTGTARLPLTNLFFAIPLRTNVVIYLVVIIFVLLLTLTYNFTKGPAGRAMLSMKNSESAAQTMGVNLLTYRILAFVISTTFAMISGYLYILYNRGVTISEFGLNKSLSILAAVVVGGTGSIWGLLLGTLLIFSMNGFVFQNIPFFAANPTLMLFFNGILMIVVVLFYPGGISQLIRQGKFKLAILKKKNQDRRALKLAVKNNREESE